MTNRKKLIEVALPLDAINSAAAREKAIRRGHPSTLHLWWARRPLAAARAVIFAQTVDDPSSRPELFPTKRVQDKERERLFHIIEELVKWKNTTNEVLLKAARDEIRDSWRRTCTDNADHPRAGRLFDPERPPAFHDPFAGGGALPLEAQRLGLEAHASDLNPVSVLINKAMIEIPPTFAGHPPVNPEARLNQELVAGEWTGVRGMAEDVQYYGRWMRDEAESRIGHLYPKIAITNEMVRARPDLKPYAGQKLRVIAWLWARTVRSPNPAFANVEIPLISTYMLSTKRGKEAYVQPVVDETDYRLTVKTGVPKNAAAAKSGTKLSRGANFRCLMSGVPISSHYIRTEGRAGRIGSRLMAIVAEGVRGRVYLEPTDEHAEIAQQAKPEWRPDVVFFEHALGFRIGNYGMKYWSDLFTPRQLVALTTLADLVTEAHECVIKDANDAGLPVTADTQSSSYADAIAVYLAFAVSKTSNRASTLCTFKLSVECPGDTFGRQALPMSWDFAEANTIGGPSGSFESMLLNTVAGLRSNDVVEGAIGHVYQTDAKSQSISHDKVISTDPPYYDNIGYADLSDFFYVWLRRSIKSIVPELFDTIVVPKTAELVATPNRHGSKEEAERFFLEGMTEAMHCLAGQSHPSIPVTIYYAFKQSEVLENSSGGSTGWETFLEAVIRSGFTISATWPVRTERENRKRNQGANALASSIVLACRKRSVDAPTATRRDFIAELKAELPLAISDLQRANIAPVDLAQAAIGPGMAVYTGYAKVLDATGNRIAVGHALALINQTLDEILGEQEGDFDADSRWALAWFEQHGFDEGKFGIAETLSKAKNTTVTGMVEAGLVQSRAGRVRLLRPDELPADWDPAQDDRLTTWEMVHHLIRVLAQGGESAAAELARKLGGFGEVARELCYRLYTVCERKKRASEALAYNGLVQSWPEISRLATMTADTEQRELFANDGTELRR